MDRKILNKNILSVLVFAIFAFLALGSDEKEKQDTTGSSTNKKEEEVLIDHTATVFANKSNNVFHRRDCLKTEDSEGLIVFATAQQASESGSLPCNYCKPAQALDSKADTSQVSRQSNGKTYRPLSKELEKQYPGIREKEKRMKRAISEGDSETLYRELFPGDLPIESYGY